MRSANNNERGNERGDSTVLENCVILDSSAVFHIRDPSIMMTLGDKIYVTDKVLEELKDPRALAIIDILSPEKIEIEDEKIEKESKKHKELSKADLSIIICVEILKKTCKKITVVTDDIKLSKILRKMGVNVVSVYYPPHKNVKRRN